MKPYLYFYILLVIASSILLYDHVFEHYKNNLSEQVNDYQQNIKIADRSVKTFVNETKEFACWISQVGELHFISGDTSRHLHHLDSAWKNVTFIEDFCLNPGNDSVYFTDLMDLKTGESAIKVTDSRGDGLKILAHLPDEIPYQICTSAAGDLLFYLAKQKNKDSAFMLRFINLKDGRYGMLYSSKEKITSLEVNEKQSQVLVNDPGRGLISFATDFQSIHGLAEAIQ